VRYPARGMLIDRATALNRPTCARVAARAAGYGPGELLPSVTPVGGELLADPHPRLQYAVGKGEAQYAAVLDECVRTRRA
jgi:hypothetical protein